MSEEIYDPRERLEIFLNAIRTGDVEDLPDPQTREEMYLLAIASKSALPDPTDASAGDALLLDEDKNPVWSTPASTPIYEHNIRIGYTSGSFQYNTVLTLYNTSSAQMAVSDVAKWLKDTGRTAPDRIYPAPWIYFMSGYSQTDGSAIMIQNGMYSSNGTSIKIEYNIITAPANDGLKLSTASTLTLSVGGVDTVRQIV